MLIYRLLADLLVVVHGLLAAFVVIGFVVIVLGGLLRWRCIRSVRFRVTHLVLVAAIALFPLVGSICPLTSWEQWLRDRGGEETYPGSFVGYWVHELLFVEVSPRVIAASYVVFAILVIVMFLVVPPRLRGKHRRARVSVEE